MSGQDMRNLMEAIANVSVDNVHRTSINLTGEQWDLFTHSMDTTKAAEALNNAVEENVNNGLSREEVEVAVEKIMDQYAQYGARDTEPRAVLNQLLDELYGIENIYEDVVQGPWSEPKQTPVQRMEKIPMHQMFGRPEYAAIRDAGFKFDEKPGYMSEIDKEINVRDIQTIEQTIGRKLNSYEMSNILIKYKGEYYPQSNAKFESLKNDETFILWDTETNDRYLVNRTGASSYIRMWARLVN